MDSLRPDIDELHQYKSRKSAGSKSTGGKKAPAGTVDENVSMSGLRLTQPSGGFGKFVVLVLVLVSCGLGYLVWKQQASIEVLNTKLSDSENFINQSKLLMARLEGELSETGAELEQSGSVAQKKLAFLDSEMRKLWGVSNDRNKKSIKKNEDDIATVANKVNKTVADIGSMQAAYKAQITRLQKQLVSAESRIAMATGEMSIIRAEQDEAIKSMQSRLVSVQANVGELKKSMTKLASDTDKDRQKIAEVVPSIASINESRRQLVQRVIGLERQLEQLTSDKAGEKDDLTATPVIK